jgi:hypothetical protein
VKALDPQPLIFCRAKTQTTTQGNGTVKNIGEKLFLTLLCLGLILFALRLWAANPSAMTAPSKGEAQGGSLEELNKELSNPVSGVWSIAFQQNTNWWGEATQSQATRVTHHWGLGSRGRRI